MPTRRDAADDDFLFHQGPARGLGEIRFHDWRAAYDAVRRRAQRRPLPRAGRRAVPSCCTHRAPDEDQQKDLDFLLTLGELFTLVVYGQLILEQARADRPRRRRRRPDLRRARARLLRATRSSCTARLVAPTPSRRGRWARSAARSSTGQRFGRVWSRRSRRWPARTRCSPEPGDRTMVACHPPAAMIFLRSARSLGVNRRAA